MLKMLQKKGYNAPNSLETAQLKKLLLWIMDIYTSQDKRKSTQTPHNNWLTCTMTLTTKIDAQKQKQVYVDAQDKS